VSEHQILQLDKPREEVHRLGFSVLLVSEPFVEFIEVYEHRNQYQQEDLGWLQHTLSSNNLITNPDLRSLRLRLAVSVDLLLIESPIGELVAGQHHVYSGHRMLQLEVVGLGGQHLSLVTINQAQVEQGLIMPHLILGRGSELLVGGETGGSDIVGHQERVGLSVEELDDIVMADNPSAAGLRESLGRNDDPVVVLILMGVAGNLLALTANSFVRVVTGIALRMRVQQVLGVHVLDRNGVKVTNLCRQEQINAAPNNIRTQHTVAIHQQFIANQGLLECRRHESVTCAGVGEDGEVDPEEEEVEDQRNDDETNHSGEEVFGNTFLRYALEKSNRLWETERIHCRISSSPRGPKGRPRRRYRWPRR